MTIYPIVFLVATLASCAAYSASGSDPMPTNRASWITMGDYPSDALAAKRTGKTVFRVKVDKKGVVKSCEIVKSSGHSDLDHVTCQYISERAVFEPAQTSYGHAVAGTYQNSVRWQVP